MRDKIHQKLRSNAICGAMDNGKRRHIRFPHGQGICNCQPGWALKMRRLCQSDLSWVEARPDEARGGEARAWIKRGGEGRRGKAKANFRSASRPGQDETRRDRQDGTGQTRQLTPGRNKDTAVLGRRLGIRRAKEDGGQRGKRKRKKKPRRDENAEASNRQVKGSREK